MINHGGMGDIIYYRKIRELGMSDEYFFALPAECQKAIIMAGCDDKLNRRKERENFQKRIALKQYEFDEKVKEKVLSLIKKNK